MVTTPDRRVRRTRAALREALLDLMSERGYEAVTVQDIIERADVGRSTFYNHYTDKDELLRDGFAGLRGMLTEPGPTGTRRWLRFSLPLLRHVDEQRRLVRALLGRRARTPMRQIEEVLIGIVRDEVGADTGAVPAEAVARYVVGAYVGLLEWWLTSRPRMSPEEADRLFHTLVAPGLRAATRPV
jgi:AcrR family transcriptional regulator